MSKNLKERIAVLQKEQEQLRARAQQLQSQFNEKERKTTQRRKFVVGALVLKDIETNAALRNHLITLLGSAPERDKKPFPDLLPVAVASSTN
jgi:Tfp pilus assembly protein PilN